MTLILAAANQRNTVLVSDRRLSYEGQLVDDEANKSIVFICRNARLVVAYTGLAKAGTFLTGEWLPRVLMEAAAPDYLMESTIERLRKKATSDLASVQVRNPTDKRLSIVLAGYSYEEWPPRVYCWLVSNFEGLDNQPPRAVPVAEFGAQYVREIRPSVEEPLILLAVGADRALSDGDFERLQVLLRGNRPPRAVIDKGVSVIRAAAQSDRSGGVIGQQCTSILLPSNPDEDAIGEYHSAAVSDKLFYPSFVNALGDGSGVYALRDPELGTLAVGTRPMSLSVPKVGRNQPCPCGSGLKYKQCHGRLKRGPSHEIRFR
jgi:hypothetical protein